MKHWWTDYPWRLVQTNLREIDMEHMDAEAYAEGLQEFGATVAMINTGGILASYPSEVADHTVSEYLTGDSLKDMMDACHRRGIRVIARMDFSKARREVYERHPEWAYRDRNGGIIDFYGDVHMCICGGFQQEKSLEILDEVMAMLPIDGVFLNMGGFQTTDYSGRDYGICHCENCRRLFRQHFGSELPERTDRTDPTWRRYLAFRRQITEETRARIDRRIRETNPELAIDGVDFFRREANTEYRRPGALWQYNASSSARVIRTLDPDRICSCATVDYVGFAYRHISVGAELHALRLRQAIANYGGLDYYLIGPLQEHWDRSAYPAVRNAFAYMAKHEALYRGMELTAEALVVREGKHMASEEARGWIRALTECHIPFGEAEPGMLRACGALSRFKVIILTDLRDLSGKLADQLDDYVDKGGCLIVSGMTGLYDEFGEQRRALPFRSLGNARITETRSDLVTAMLEIRPEDRPHFPSLPETDLIFFGEELLLADYDGRTECRLRLIPPHPPGAPERCYWGEVTDLPGCAARAYGKGKAVHIPWCPGKLYDREGYDNTFSYLKDMLLTEAGLRSPVEGLLSPMVEVTLGRSRDRSRTMVHLVNNSGHYGRTHVPPLPVAEVCVGIPSERAPERVNSLTEGSAVSHRWEDGILHLQISHLEAFAAICILYN